MENQAKRISAKCNVWCCVPQCTNKPYASIHHFPKDKYLKKQWIIACRIGKTLTSNMVVCNAHFCKQDFIPNRNQKRCVLKKNVIPTVNLPVRTHDKVVTSAQNEKIKNRADRLTKRQLQKEARIIFVNMGKKRGSQAPVPDLIKIEVKDEIDSNVVMARDRFRGALRELLNPSDEGSSADSGDESPVNDYRSPVKKDQYRPKQLMTQSRKMKKRRQMHMDSAFHHTYVMKLFDRSVDLAQFQEDTPLYPICRAWMANQPRNPNLVPKARSPSPDVAPEATTTINNMFDENAEIQDVHSLPAPLPSEEAFPRNRIPSPIPVEKEDLDLNYDGRSLKSKETLLRDHREHWVATRKKWHQQSHKNEERYAESAAILGTIFKRAQSEFD